MTLPSFKFIRIFYEFIYDHRRCKPTRVQPLFICSEETNPKKEFPKVQDLVNNKKNISGNVEPERSCFSTLKPKQFIKLLVMQQQ